MKLLLISAGISNASIHNALLDLFGKPFVEASAIFVSTAIYAFPGEDLFPQGSEIAASMIRGQSVILSAIWAGGHLACWRSLLLQV